MDWDSGGGSSRNSLYYLAFMCTGKLLWLLTACSGSRGLGIYLVLYPLMVFAPPAPSETDNSKSIYGALHWLDGTAPAFSLLSSPRTGSYRRHRVSPLVARKIRWWFSNWGTHTAHCTWWNEIPIRIRWVHMFILTKFIWTRFASVDFSDLTWK